MKKLLMLKNLFVIALLLITFFKNVSGAKPLTEICLKNAYEYILNCPPKQLIELARGEKALPQEIAYEISKALITKNSTLFFPKVDGYPKIKQISQHNNEVKSAVFSPDGQFILTACDDNTAKLWNLNRGPIATFQHGSWVNSAVFSPDGQFILTASDDGTAKLWEIHPLWNSPKYRNGQLSLQELATILLILKHKDFVKSDPEAQATIYGVLNQIDGNVPANQRHIKNFFASF